MLEAYEDGIELNQDSLTLPNNHCTLAEVPGEWTEEDLRQEPILKGGVLEMREHLGPIAKNVLACLPAKYLSNDFYIRVILEEYTEDEQMAPGEWHFDGEVELRDGKLMIESTERLLCVVGGNGETEVLQYPFSVNLENLTDEDSLETDLMRELHKQIEKGINIGSARPRSIANQQLFEFHQNTPHRRGQIQRKGLRLLVGFGRN